MTDRVSPNETQTFSYDNAGRRTAWSDASGNSTVTFDDVGRMTGITNPAGTVSYGYNAAGEQTTMVQPEGTVTNAYDANGFMASVTDWRGDTIAMTNDADGRMLTQERSNNVDTGYSYDTAGRLTGIDHANGATVIDGFVYSLDSNGNRTGVTSNAGTETYTLDALNRLTAVTYPGAVSEAFVYDAAGNRTSHTKTDGSTVGYTVDPTGQLVSDTTGTTYSYDAAGNLTSTSDGVAYGYDDYGRHETITAGGVTQTYGYDATGTRVTVDGETQLWDRTGLPTLISTSAGDNYVHTAGISRDGDAWLLADAVGSIRATTDGTGAVSGTAGFTASGETLAGATGTFGYAGEQQDPTGLIHLRARQYNPTLGRFATVDPVQPGAPGTTGYNLYAYSGNNPTTWGDPSGRFAEAASTYKPVEIAAPAIAGLGLAVKTKLILGALAIGSTYAITDCILATYGIDAGPGCSSASGSNGNGGLDDPTELIELPNPYQDLADAYGIDPSAIENCLLNHKKNKRACDGIPGALLRQLIGDQGRISFISPGPNFFGLEAEIEDGTLGLYIKRGESTPMGHQMFAQAMDFFGDEIERIEGTWLSSDASMDTNFNEYRAGVAAGLSPAEAALGTFTGRQASLYGFRTVESIVDQGTQVLVIFVK